MYAKNDMDNRAGSFIFSGITRPTTIAGSELHAIFVCRTMFKKYLLRSQLQTDRLWHLISVCLKEHVKRAQFDLKLITKYRNETDKEIYP